MFSNLSLYYISQGYIMGLKSQESIEKMRLFHMKHFSNHHHEEGYAVSKMGKPSESSDTVYMNVEQSRFMSDWVTEILKIININHADFYELVELQYPDREEAFHQSIVIGCVCQAIMHTGISYLQSISGGSIKNDKIEEVLHFALYHEIKQLNDPEGPHTQQ
jgi:hypothetical protein